MGHELMEATFNVHRRRVFFKKKEVSRGRKEREGAINATMDAKEQEKKENFG